MPDPGELIAVARSLALGDDTSGPTDAHLRRAASAAYYAVFHNVCRATAERFVGPDKQKTSAFNLIYRSLQHRRFREVCEALQAPVLKERYKNQLGREAVSQEVRDFASIIPTLQEERHRADYDPARAMLQTDVLSMINAAETAINTFNRVTGAEQTDILALPMVGARA